MAGVWDWRAGSSSIASWKLTPLFASWKLEERKLEAYATLEG